MSAGEPALEATLEAWRVRRPRRRLAAPRVTRAARRPAAAAVALAALAMAGAGLAARGLWIPAKALVAQALLARAWERARAGEAAPRPWPWADTWPVGRLRLPGGPAPVVLAGASGRTLAFGPGHVDGTARPGEAGNVVLAGHRDTHFRALARLAPGDLLRLEVPGGGTHRYRVAETAIVDHRDTRPLSPDGASRLTLVTCWPFDALRAGGPWRYVVVADEEPRPAAR